MLKRIHAKLGTAGFIISIVALVVALGGAAYAAGGLTSKQKREVTAIAKKYAGKPGPQGPAGSPGSAGPAGAAGKEAAIGKEGPQGKEGKEAKQGKEGPEGKSGFTDTLPKGKTETGVWSAFAPATGFQELASISFSIPLAAPGEAFFLTPTQIEEEEGPGFEAGCTGSVAEPVAPEGVLCVYTHELEDVSLVHIAFPAGDEFGYQRTGTLVRLFAETEGELLLGNGSWAVTAP